VVQGPGGIETRAARHGRHGTTVTQTRSILNTISTLRPLIRKVDYDKDEDADRKLFDMTYNGPLVFVAYTW
jgi:hypothetical protein